AQTGETWATYRGNPARTGSDGQAGPREATVLWACKSGARYSASPLPLGDRLYVSGLGAVNRGIFACLSTRSDIKTRTLWARQSTGPTVSSPGAFKSWLIFGDGMHQTNGASLYCLDAVEGGRVWRRSIRGDLVHVEGSPTLVDGKAYVGGGNAGVLCFEIERATLNGKAYGLPELQKLNAATLKELQAKYEIARKTDPFAFPVGGPASRGRAQTALATGQGQMARRCPDQCCRRPRTGLLRVPRQGARRRPSPFLPRRQDRRRRLARAAQVESLGWAVGPGRAHRCLWQLHRLRSQRHQGSQGLHRRL